MTAKEFADKNGFEILCGGESLSREVTGCYIGDMLSRVMGRAPEGCVWLTIMTNNNVAAVAAMAQTACVLLCEGVKPDEQLINTARDRDITVLSTELDAYAAALMIKL